MKRLIAIVLVITFCCLSFCGCNEKPEAPQQPLVLVESLSDQYGNLLNQIYYNNDTKEYLLKEYIYEYVDKKWVCVEQTTTVYQTLPSICEDYYCYDSSLLSVFSNSDLTDNSITVMNNDDVKITIIKYLKPGSWWEFGYELRIDNKTNKVLTMTIVDTYIMDIPCEPVFNIDHIDAYGYSSFRLVWDKPTLERNYIPYIDNVRFMIKIFDTSNWNTPAKYGTNILIKN